MITQTTNANIHHSNQKITSQKCFASKKNLNLTFSLCEQSHHDRSLILVGIFFFCLFPFLKPHVRFPQSYAELLHQQALLLRCAYAQAWAWLPPNKKQKRQLTATHFLLHRGTSSIRLNRFREKTNDCLLNLSAVLILLNFRINF